MRPSSGPTRSARRKTGSKFGKRRADVLDNPIELLDDAGGSVPSSVPQQGKFVLQARHEELRIADKLRLVRLMFDAPTTFCHVGMLQMRSERRVITTCRIENQSRSPRPFARTAQARCAKSSFDG